MKDNYESQDSPTLAGFLANLEMITYRSHGIAVFSIVISAINMVTMLIILIGGK